MSDAPFRVLFVCLGNICRSPAAEGVARSIAAQRGCADAFHFDSAGTGGWHHGAPPDPRTVRAVGARGIDISALRARRIETADFGRFDLMVAMDHQNLDALLALRGAAQLPLKLMLDFAPELPADQVPDPYYGPESGFETMLQQIEIAAQGLIESRLRGDI